MNALVRNDIWDLVSLPKGKYINGTKWVYKTKYKSDDIVDKYKSHLVAKGYTQKDGSNYIKTFSLVEKLETIRVSTLR